MANIFKSLARDMARLVKEPTALIVLVAILVLPSAYSWYNVAEFWDPYNNTSNISVTVVNEDAGSTTSVTGDMNVGNTIIDTLKTNTQLGWQFMSREDAMDALQAGETYAVYVIPSSFTDDMIGFINGNSEIKHAKLEYYVNEKSGPVSPKVTDAGATTLDQTVNSMFVETVTNAVVGVYDKALTKAKTKTDEVKTDATSKVSEALEQVKGMRSSIQTVDGKLASAQSEKTNILLATRECEDKLDSAKEKLTEISSSMSSVSSVMGYATSDVETQLADSIVKLQELQLVADKIELGDRLDPLIDALYNRYDILSGSVNPALVSLPNTLSNTADRVATTAENQKSLMRQNESLVDQLNTNLASARDALASTDKLLETTQNDLEGLQNDISTLSASTVFSKLYNNGNLDSESIANYLGSATKVKQECLYSLSVYGAAMAPLFMSLTLWIGAFMFLVVFRQEADDEGIENFTVAQRYISRFIFFAVPAMLQAVVCCTGLLVIDIGVQDIPSFYFASIISSLTYMSTIYSLSLLLQHVGKGLCVALIFLQIPAGTGLYPLELTAPFYQIISSVMPFTYGISALRESICGFYGSTFSESIGILLIYFAVFMLLGVFLRPLLSNVNRMVARELSESGLMNGELVDVPERRFKLNQMLLLLTDRAGYHNRLQANYSRFLSLYPRLMIGGLILAVAIPTVSGLICSSVGASRIIILNIWLVVFLLYILYVVALETTRNGMRNQFALEELTEEEMASQYGKRDMTHTTRRHNTRFGKNSFKAWQFNDIESEGHEEAKRYHKDSEMRVQASVHAQANTQSNARTSAVSASQTNAQSSAQINAQPNAQTSVVSASKIDAQPNAQTSGEPISSIGAQPSARTSAVSASQTNAEKSSDDNSSDAHA